MCNVTRVNIKRGNKKMWRNPFKLSSGSSKQKIRFISLLAPAGLVALWAVHNSLNGGVL